MTAIHGDIHPPKWSEFKQLWRTTIDPRVGPDCRRRRVEVSDRTKAGCVARRRKRIRKIEDGTYPPGQKPTVTAWIRHWLDHIAATRIMPRILANYRR